MAENGSYGASKASSLAVLQWAVLFLTVKVSCKLGNTSCEKKKKTERLLLLIALKDKGFAVSQKGTIHWVIWSNLFCALCSKLGGCTAGNCSLTLVHKLSFHFAVVSQ